MVANNNKKNSLKKDSTVLLNANLFIVVNLRNNNVPLPFEILFSTVWNEDYKRAFFEIVKRFKNKRLLFCKWEFLKENNVNLNVC